MPWNLVSKVKSEDHWWQGLKRNANPRPLFVYFHLFKQMLHFLQQICVKNVHWVYGAGNRTHNISGHESPPITTGPVLQPIGDQLLFEIFDQEWPNRILIFWSIIRWSTLMYWKNSEDCFYPFYGILQLLFGVKTCLSLSISLSSVHGINSKEELVRRDVLFFKRLCRPRHQKGQKRFVEYLSQMLINLKSSSISNCNPDPNEIQI